MSSLLMSSFKRISNNRKNNASTSSNAESVISTKAASEVNDNGNVIISLERVSSKEDVYEGNMAKKPSVTLLRKRNTSSKEEELLEIVLPAMKRSNSKTDVKDGEITVAPTAIVSSKPKRRSYMVPGLADLEQATNNEGKMQHAIQVAKQYHCAEGLEFLLALREWEELDAGKKKDAALASLQNNFIKEKSAHEVCLPTALRTRMSKGELNPQDILEAKRCIFNDIRFNERVLYELLS